MTDPNTSHPNHPDSITVWPRVPYVGVACILIRDGKILLMRRQGAHGAGSWSTPGGHLDFGESPAECAARETMEEVGIIATNLRFVAITNDVFTEADKHYITIWMQGEPEGEASIQSTREIAELGWFDLNELPSSKFLSFENLLSRRCLPDLTPTLQTLPQSPRS